ncbi:hypothetical protein T440DRAFT_106121 [Plenodomus tracheiphilus IPT5]|uniref:Uncharacterized protein n=1 Tax=Plenodomus tracheiphilus IPT5 TaxID=1408161 RepID=A0A6A7BM02_9PLEO|nr:hypothetical protein T440DRAFT_106121 [Plenodomus tracheiphilus IPT5]
MHQVDLAATSWWSTSGQAGVVGRHRPRPNHHDRFVDVQGHGCTGQAFRHTCVIGLRRFASSALCVCMHERCWCMCSRGTNANVPQRPEVCWTDAFQPEYILHRTTCSPKWLSVRQVCSTEWTRPRAAAGARAGWGCCLLGRLSGGDKRRETTMAVLVPCVAAQCVSSSRRHGRLSWCHGPTSFHLRNSLHSSHRRRAGVPAQLHRPPSSGFSVPHLPFAPYPAKKLRPVSSQYPLLLRRSATHAQLSVPADPNRHEPATHTPSTRPLLPNPSPCRGRSKDTPGQVTLRQNAYYPGRGRGAIRCLL